MKKGFTLIELIVVIAIIGVLVGLAVGVTKGYTKEAQLAKHISYVKELESASERYYMKEGKWPRAGEEPYTADEVKAYSEMIRDITGQEVELEAGNYYDISYEDLSKYTKIPVDRENYILQNPVGRIYYLEKLTEIGQGRVEPAVKTKGIYSEEEIKSLIAQGYTTVTTVEDLDNVRNKLTGKYIQTKNIDLTGIYNWEPVGGVADRFGGTYDGGGYIISNLTINRPGEDYVGLFGYLSGGTVKNIGIEHANILGKQNIGGLVGYNSGKIANSYTTGSVEGIENYVGGLAGYNSGVIDSSYASAKVKTSNQYAGGLVGQNRNSGSKIVNSYSTGDVTGRYYIGGLVGCNGNNSRLENSYSIGRVDGGNQYVGGLVGASINYAEIKNSYYDMNTSGMTDITNGGRLTTVQMMQKIRYNGWDFQTIWKINDGEYPKLQWQK